MTCMIRDEIMARFLQYLAPIVFGIISVITKIKIVKIADIIPKEASPNILTACAPTPAAPTVCATVFNDNIADKGLSILVFKSINGFAQVFPFSCLTIKKDCGVERSTDSIIEQRNETKRARNK